jgi:hypothetical protein
VQHARTYLGGFQKISSSNSAVNCPDSTCTVFKWNVADEWLQCLIPVGEVLGSYFGPQIGCSDWIFLRNCPQSIQIKVRTVALKQTKTASFRFLSSSSFTGHPIIRYYIIWVTDSLVKQVINKQINSKYQQRTNVLK